MAWARLDDRFHENRKVKKVWKKCPAAIGLHVMALTYSAGHQLDGFIDREFVEEKMPVARMREKACAMLVEVRLWIPEDSGWLIHDFHEYNPTRADAQARRAARSEAARNAANTRWGNAERMRDALPDACAPHDAEMRIDAPVPTRPVERAKALSSAPTGTDAKEQREIDKASDDDQRLCRLLAELLKQRNPKFKVKSKTAWLREMRLLRQRDENTPDEIERLIRWIFADTSKEATFWAGTIQSPANLREHFAQVWGKMTVTPIKAVAEDSSSAVAAFGRR